MSLRSAPQHERAWQRGSLGEESVARSLERRTGTGPAIILHDRRMPGVSGNIDHLAITPSGVYVIDAKAVRGKVRVSQPLLGKPKLLVNGRNRPRLVDGLDRQVAAVRGALASTEDGDVPVVGVLCFTQADLPLLGSSRIRGHRLHYRRALARRLNRNGPLARPAIRALARKLASEFRPPRAASPGRVHVRDCARRTRDTHDASSRNASTSRFGARASHASVITSSRSATAIRSRRTRIAA